MGMSHEISFWILSWSTIFMNTLIFRKSFPKITASPTPSNAIIIFQISSFKVSTMKEFRSPLCFLLKALNMIVKRLEEINLETSQMNIMVFCPKAASWARSSRVSHDVYFSINSLGSLKPFHCPSNPILLVCQRLNCFMGLLKSRKFQVVLKQV